MDTIQVENLRKEFESVTAVDGVSFAVEEGEVFGLLGPNGAGKTTLINMLVTLLNPTDGSATVAGHDIVDERGAVRDSLGIVFQEPALDEELTGAENLAFHGRLYGMDAATRRARIDDVLDLVGLDAERDDPVSTYSGGMKRRLEIGRGLLHRPEVLFLDEPTVGLDARTRRDTWEYIQGLNDDSGVSIVLTTHYIEEAERLCDRVAIVDEGEIVAVDTPTTLKDDLGGDVVTMGVSGPVDGLLAELGDRPWVEEATRSDDSVRVVLERGETRIADLVRTADDVGVTIDAVEHHETSLEAVFLALTGSTIADAEGTADADTPDQPTAAASATDGEASDPGDTTRSEPAQPEGQS
ncbi:ABC transporter ATP-binding protein [Halorhabdus tiamatea SARL4B]|uniref:ABC transporter ATP-binding protein n=1 Tax=Halorhabdus tiamatea SARL4B TaxID=1033806 RepID=F7PPY3_9EURY|nr:daunorubicin resistance protein DrrA family ABC transporter ATP-binding protein [Halorhabdus tiamatea]ERJ07328.1 ABC transporter ATP-binding protein [Halorhabdus tiamatea SARL4B]CCQ34105.1 ABC transporter, ATP-binding protein [Halorhabdus tiamatea SARL4B]